jgi:hypothetical protein
MKKTDITVGKLREALVRLGYAFFENGDYNLNVIGVRSSDDSSNRFNDFIAVAYKINNQWRLKVFGATTDPGLYWRERPMNVKGTAILSAGQHRSCYKLGKHRNKYDALVQAKKLPVYRDNDRDQVLDRNGALDVGFHGINIHHASAKHESVRVDKWSAGCQVIANPDRFCEFIELCKESTKRYGEKLTYTLIEEKDLN